MAARVLVNTGTAHACVHAWRRAQLTTSGRHVVIAVAGLELVREMLRRRMTTARALHGRATAISRGV